MANLNKELERIEQGNAWEESDEVVQLDVKKPLDKVVPIRLQAADWAKLREEARELGVGPTTLARMWILERLRLQSAPLKDAALVAVYNALRESLSRDIGTLEHVDQYDAYRQFVADLDRFKERVNRITESLRKIEPGVLRESMARRESKQKV
jgi:hypothetical protein